MLRLGDEFQGITTFLEVVKNFIFMPSKIFTVRETCSFGTYVTPNKRQKLSYERKKQARGLNPDAYFVLS